MPIPVESSTPAPVGTLDGRLRFPATDDRLAYESHGPNLPLLSQAGKPVVIYADAAGSILADIVNDAGAAIANSTLTVDNNSQIPEFFGPVGVEVLYARLNGGTAYPIYAWLQGRLNDVDAQFTALNTNDALSDSRLDTLEAYGIKGQANGLAPLGPDTRVPIEFLPDTGSSHTHDSLASDAEVAAAYLAKADNLAAVANKATARTNLSVSSTAEIAAAYVAKAGGDTITASGTSVIPLVVKGTSGQTANALEVRSSAGLRLASFGANGSLRLDGDGAVGLGVQGDASGIAYTYLTTASAGVRPLVVRGAGSQTASLAEFQNSAGTALSSVLADGRISVKNSGPEPSSVFNASITVNNTDRTSGIAVIGTVAGASGLVVRGASGQTANLAEFQNSAGTVLASFNNNGTLVAEQNAIIVASGAAGKPLTVRGAAGQTANLAEFQNNAGTVLAGYDSAGREFFPSVQFTSNVLGTYMGKVRVNVDGNSWFMPVYL